MHCNFFPRPFTCFSTFTKRCSDADSSSVILYIAIVETEALVLRTEVIDSKDRSKSLQRAFQNSPVSMVNQHTKNSKQKTGFETKLRLLKKQQRQTSKSEMYLGAATKGNDLSFCRHLLAETDSFS